MNVSNRLFQKDIQRILFKKHINKYIPKNTIARTRYVALKRNVKNKQND